MADLAHLHRNSPAGVARWCGTLRAGPPHQDAGMSLVDNWLASCRENVIGDEWMAFVCGDLKPEPVNRTAWKRKRRIRKAGSGSAETGRRRPAAIGRAGRGIASHKCRMIDR